MCAEAHGGREGLRSPKFGVSHTVVSHWMWVLGIRLRAPARPASALNCRVILSSHRKGILKRVFKV